MEKFLAILSIGILMVYNFYAMVIYRGVPPSLSDSYYKTKKLFQLSMVFSTVLLIPYLTNLSYWWGYITPIGLIFVGMFPDFKKDRINGGLHYLGAIMSFLGAFVIIYISGDLLLSVGIGLVYTLGIYFVAGNFKKSVLFYLELFAFSSLFVDLIASF